jgi:hypothetical protein
VRGVEREKLKAVFIRPTNALLRWIAGVIGSGNTMVNGGIPVEALVVFIR